MTRCRTWIVIALAAVAIPALAQQDPTGDVIVIVGAAGEPTYGEKFREWAGRWETAGRRGGWRTTVIGLDAPADGAPDRDALEQAIAAAAVEKEAPLWLVFIGHGTFDKRSTKFNLRGPDIGPDDVTAWLAPLERPVAMIDCSSASGPFLPRLSRPNRVVITATKTGGEQFFTRFGDHLSLVIAAPAADLDKDGQTSLFEAFLEASRRTTRSYDDEQKRVVSEHAILDDDGDGIGALADAYRGLEPDAKATAGRATLDGRIAHTWHLVRSDADRALTPDQLRRRTDLEVQVRGLRDRKAEMAVDAYAAELERLLVEIAEINESAGR